MDVLISTPVRFTPTAVHEIKRLMNESDFDTRQKLRVGVKGGGCSGMTYILGFDEQKENDECFELEGVSCILDKSHEMYIYGMTIDWMDGLNSRGFTFINPNASSTCGCGTSFAI